MSSAESISTCEGQARMLQVQAAPMMLNAVRYPHHMADVLLALSSMSAYQISHEAVYVAVKEASFAAYFELLKPIDANQKLDEYVDRMTLHDR